MMRMLCKLLPVLVVLFLGVRADASSVSNTSVTSSTATFTVVTSFSRDSSYTWYVAVDVGGTAGGGKGTPNVLAGTGNGTNQTITGVVLTGLSPSTAYSISLYETHSGATSYLGTAGTVTTSAGASPPNVPTSVASTAISTGLSATVTWVAPAAGTTPTGYKIYRGGTLLTTVGTVLTYTDSTVSLGATYTYGVATTNAAGDSTTVNASALTIPNVPSAPTFTVVPSSSTSIVIAWSTVGTATGYTVYRNSTLLVTSQGVTYTDTAVAAGTSYSYYVVATNAVGASITPTAVVVTTSTQSTGGSGSSGGGSVYPFAAGSTGTIRAFSGNVFIVWLGTYPFTDQEQGIELVQSSSGAYTMQGGVIYNHSGHVVSFGSISGGSGGYAGGTMSETDFIAGYSGTGTGSSGGGSGGGSSGGDFGFGTAPTTQPTVGDGSPTTKPAKADAGYGTPTTHPTLPTSGPSAPWSWDYDFSGMYSLGQSGSASPPSGAHFHLAIDPAALDSVSGMSAIKTKVSAAVAFFATLWASWIVWQELRRQ